MAPTRPGKGMAKGEGKRQGAPSRGYAHDQLALEMKHKLVLERKKAPVGPEAMELLIEGILHRRLSRRKNFILTLKGELDHADKETAKSELIKFLEKVFDSEMSVEEVHDVGKKKFRCMLSYYDWKKLYHGYHEQVVIEDEDPVSGFFD